MLSSLIFEFSVDISPYLNQKLELLRIDQSEVNDFPFPRSETAIQALVEFRGSNVGSRFSEGFMLLRILE